jgi:hypothetical protein
MNESLSNILNQSKSINLSQTSGKGAGGSLTARAVCSRDSFHVQNFRQTKFFGNEHKK